MSNSPTSEQFKLSQQAVNIIRQLVNATGWTETITDMVTAGDMLKTSLPKLDPLDWLKTEKEIVEMNPTDRVAYLEKDRAWGEKELTFTLSDEEKKIVVRAFRFNFEQLKKAGKLGPNPVLYEVIKAFGIKDNQKKD